MAKPLLFLHIEQGPKSGERVKCKPSAKVTIGRARGNTLQISQDAGISQKHLTFFWAHGDDARWFARDVGSSNGTLINDLQIEPKLPIAINAGDLIKIGAETTIRVEISEEIHGKDTRLLEENSGKKSIALCEENRNKGGPLGKKDHGNDIVVPGECLNECIPTSAEHKKGEVLPKERGKHDDQCDARKPLVQGIDLNMTVEQWFTHMMEEGPKYLYKVSESMIQDILLESKQFDEYVLSLNQGK